MKENLDWDGLRDTFADIIEYLEKELPYASAGAYEKRELFINIDSVSQTVEQNDYGTGAVVRALVGDLFLESASNDLGKTSLRCCARDLLKRKTKASGVKPHSRGNGGRKDFQILPKDDPEVLPLKEKLDYLRAVHQQCARLDPRIRNVQVFYRETRERSLFVDRTRDFLQELPRVQATVVLYASEGTKMVSDASVRGGTGGLELVRFPEEELMKLEERTLRLLEAEPIFPGYFNIISSPEISGVIAHESFGHGVEADMFVSGRARAALYMGEKIASPLLDLVDDPSFSEGYGFYFFDDEGMMASPTKILKNGVLQRGISDISSSLRLGIPATANGRRESFANRVYARMSNTFFCPGEASLEEIFSEARDAVYLESPLGGVEDPQGWGIQVTAKIGREIEKGRPTGRVFSPVCLTGYLPELLQSITLVGKDLELMPGLCGKGSKEWVSVGMGGPHLLARGRLG